MTKPKKATEKKSAPAKKPAARTRTATNGNGGNGNGGRLTRRDVNDDPDDNRYEWDSDSSRRSDNGMAALIPLAWLLGLAAIVAVVILALWTFDVIGDDDNGNGTAVANLDSDGDGFTDAYETAHGTDPHDATSVPNGNTAIGGGTPDINNTVSGSNCPGDKVGTWSEVNAAGPQRIEVGGGGIQHADLYPGKGVKAISFIVPPTEPFIYMGFGSEWEWQCTGFDFVKDATDYARGRLNNGHSGLVYDLRNGKLNLVANVANMSDADIQTLLAQHLAAMGENAGRFTTSSSTSTLPSSNGSTSNNTAPPVVQQPAAQQPAYQAPANAPAPVPNPQPAQQSTCPDGVRGPDFPPVPGTEWNPEPVDSYRVVHLWSNWPGMDQTERKFLLFPGEVPHFQGGGSFWYWGNSDACKAAAEKGYNDTNLPAGR